MEELQKENEALQTRVNAMGIKERITPSKRGRLLVKMIYYCNDYDDDQNNNSNVFALDVPKCNLG